MTTRLSLASAALAAAAVVLALECADAQAPPAVPVANPGFEEEAPGGRPTSWGGPAAASPPADGAQPPYRVAIDADNPREGRGSARLERVGPAGSQPFGAISQAVDATSYRGRRVRFTAAVRVAAPQAAQVGLWLRVDRAAGRLGFFDNMNNRPITSTEWADYTIEGDVASDAERIMLGLLLVGDGKAWIDDVRVEDLGPAAASPTASSAELSAYLERSLALLRSVHINSVSADWPAIEARARAATAGATNLGEVHDAIRAVIADLGEPHTMLRPATPAAAGVTPEPALPSHALIDRRFGLVRLPGFLGTPEQAKRYTAKLRDDLTGMDAGGGVCGWIVDLRENTGGNMWPMLNGLDPLLGPGPFGAFRTPSGQLTNWVRGSEEIALGGISSDRLPFFTLGAADAPVAILLGPQTASSGEMTAIALTGRAHTRSFGTRSAGFTTANVSVPLSDGSVLVITTAYVRDRTGREYAGAMVPDEPVEAQEAEAAAIHWLEVQKYC